MRIIVTGGSGYLGTWVRKYFGADDFSRRSGLDILDEGSLEKIADYDVVIHLAATLDRSPQAEDAVFRTNCDGTREVLKKMKKGATFIFASTKDVYGRFADKYELVAEDCPTIYAGQDQIAWSKLVAEKYVEYMSANRGFNACIFRLSTIYSPPSKGNIPSFVGGYLEAMDAGRPIRLPAAGAAVRDILFVEDLCRAIESFIDSGLKFGLYNIGGGEKNAATLREIVTGLEAATGLQAIIDEENPLPAPVPFRYISNLGKAKQELGWEPQISNSEGFKRLI